MLLICLFFFLFFCYPFVNIREKKFKKMYKNLNKKKFSFCIFYRNVETVVRTLMFFRCNDAILVIEVILFHATVEHLSKNKKKKKKFTYELQFYFPFLWQLQGSGRLKSSLESKFFLLVLRI